MVPSGNTAEVDSVTKLPFGTSMMQALPGAWTRFSADAVTRWGNVIEEIIAIMRNPRSQRKHALVLGFGSFRALVIQYLPN